MTSPKSKRRRRWILLLSFPAGLLLTELGVRALGLEVAPLPELRGALTEKVEDADLLYENRINGQAVVLYRESSSAPPRRVRMLTNGQRFRGPAVPVERTTGVPRVVCLGDSHTFGYGVAEGESWPAHLRTLVSPDAGPIEVLNCGVNAYDTLQEVLWFEKRVAPFAPDVVVLQYYLNDTSVRGLAGAPTDRLMSWTHPRRAGALRNVRDAWRSLDLVCDSIFRRRALGDYARVRTDQYADDHPGWQRGRAALARLRDLCESNGCRLVVALYPYLVEDGGGFRSDAAFEIVRAHCAEARIECIDASAALLRAGGGALRISEIDYHGNSDANRAFAGVVASWLAGAGFAFESDR